MRHNYETHLYILIYFQLAQRRETSVHLISQNLVLQLNPQAQLERFPSLAHIKDRIHQTTFTDCIRTQIRRTKIEKLTTEIPRSNCKRFLILVSHLIQFRLEVLKSLCPKSISM